jgi:hypothetical protein
MALLLRSDAAALEHILVQLLEQPSVTASDNSIPPFPACLIAAGVSSASDFISLDPLDYRQTIPFSITKDGDKDSHLNVIQVKKLSALFSWFHQVTSPPITRWFDLTNNDFRAWRTPPDPAFSKEPNVPPPVNVPVSSAINDCCKGVRPNISDYTLFKEDRFSIPGTAT